VNARAQRAEYVAAVELRCGKKIERSGEESDPSSAADGMEKNVRDRGVGIKNCGESVKDERSAEDGTDVLWVGESGNNFRMKDAE